MVFKANISQVVVLELMPLLGSKVIAEELSAVDKAHMCDESPSEPHSEAARGQDASAKWLVFERLLCVRLYLGRSRRTASCSAAEAAISSRCSSSVSIQATS